MNKIAKGNGYFMLFTYPFLYKKYSNDLQLSVRKIAVKIKSVLVRVLKIKRLELMESAMHVLFCLWLWFDISKGISELIIYTNYFHYACMALYYA